MSDTLANALQDPGIDALIGAAQSLGQAAMPTRMPTPIGSVLSAGLGGTLGGLKTSNELQQGQQQTLAAKMLNMATASSLPLMLQKNQALTNMWAHPELMQQMMNGGSGLAPASSSSSPGVMSPGDYAAKTNLGENSTGNPAAKNPLSSAAGNGQFIDSTWLNTFKQAYPNIATGMSDPDILALKTKTTIPGVPDLQNGMTVAYARQNAPVLQAAGLPATAANLALAHRFGPDGAKTLLQAPPGTPVSGLLGADVMTANPDLKGQTAGGVVGNMTMRMGQAPVAFGTQVAGPGAPPDQTGQASSGTAPQPGQVSGANALAMAQQYEQRANDLDRQQNTAKWLQAQGLPAFPPSGDPAALRTAAQQYRALALAGPTEEAKAENSNVDLRSGGMALIQTRNGPQWVKNPVVENAQLPTGETVPLHVTPPVPGSPPGTPGSATPIMGPDGQPIVTKISPQQHEFLQKRGADLAEQYQKIDSDAASAIDGNYLFDNLRQAGKGFTMDKFADIRSDAQQWGVTAGHLLGISDDNPTMKAMIDPAATYTDFVKGAGTLLRTAVHDVSSRAAVQEYNLISSTLPHPTTLSQGFNQVADQWQGVNDFRIAKQRFAQQYQGHPQDFNVDFNGQVSPVSFMLNRMSLTPEGQVNLTTMLGDMQKTAEGRAAAQHMLHQYSFAKSKGLFDGLPPTSAPPQ